MMATEATQENFADAFNPADTQVKAFCLLKLIFNANLPRMF